MSISVCSLSYKNDLCVPVGLGQIKAVEHQNFTCCVSKGSQSLPGKLSSSAGACIDRSREAGGDHTGYAGGLLCILFTMCALGVTWWRWGHSFAKAKPLSLP